MRKLLNKFAVLIVVAVFMTSCFSTRQGCGFAQTKNNVRKANSKPLYTEAVVLKKHIFVFVANAK